MVNMLCLLAAFGADAPGDLLAGFALAQPQWLVAAGNIFVMVHLVGAYQVSKRMHKESHEGSC